MRLPCIFTKLILRELEEISPYPHEPTLNGWWEHCQKRFIHREIFKDLKKNRNFKCNGKINLNLDAWKEIHDEYQ